MAAIETFPTEPFPTFPDDFVWGTATASYQIEGAHDIDGKGMSIWDTFSHTPGKIQTGENGDIACDHYNRWETDLDLMAQLGVNAYRFSVSWPRIIPTGRGKVEQRGLDFYSRLVDGMLERGIAPYLTLYHWDLPQPLGDQGGWKERSTAEAFADYAGVVAESLGDRVAGWITLNEPFVAANYGYALGMHAPGEFLLTGVFPVVHHLLLGHGLAVQALRAAGVGPIGITNNLAPVWALDPDSEADQAAAERLDAVYNKQFVEPVLLGHHPEGYEELYVGSDFSVVQDGDLEIISEPIEFFGVNYYAPQQVKGATADNPLGFELTPITGYPTTSFDWPIVPQAFTDLLVGLHDTYGEKLPPMYVTENGCSAVDEVAGDGEVHDEDRIAYLDSHLRAIADARAAGADVRGYFCWSFMDNFEWAEGFSQRFGLVHVDFDTQVRTPKDSFAWYRDVAIASPNLKTADSEGK